MDLNVKMTTLICTSAVMFLSACTLDVHLQTERSEIGLPDGESEGPPVGLLPKILRVSVPTFTGVETKHKNTPIAMSKNGRYILIKTDSPLVEQDQNGRDDIYLYDKDTGAVERISVANDGTEANNSSDDGQISADGRFVVFSSYASNLVPSDTNGAMDVFVRDRQDGSIYLVSVNTAGAQSNADCSDPDISDDGNFVVFRSAATNLAAGDLSSNTDIFLRTRDANTTVRVSQNVSTGIHTGIASAPVISGNGRFIGFVSSGNNLVASDTIADDVFVYDRVDNVMERVSVSSAGAQQNSGWDINLSDISTDGRFVLFRSDATNLVANDTNGIADIFLRDRQDLITEMITVSDSETPANSYMFFPAYVSDDGTKVVFNSTATNLTADSVNGKYQTFLRDRVAGSTTLISKNADGVVADGEALPAGISADGKLVVFTSWASNLVTGDYNRENDAFYFDTSTSKLQRVVADLPGVEARASSAVPRISSNGRYVAFRSYAHNLIDQDTNNTDDIFVHDSQTGVTKAVSVNDLGEVSSGQSYELDLSGDGNVVVFSTEGNNLAPEDTGYDFDIYSHNLTTSKTTLISVSTSGDKADDYTDYPAVNGDGRYVAFISSATNLVPSDTNNALDVFVRDTQLNETKRVSVSSAGDQSDGGVRYEAPAISQDGQLIVFASNATNMVAGDTNNQTDIFVHDQVAQTTRRVSLAFDNSEADGSSWKPAISGDGKFVAFLSDATNLVENDTNGATDIFLYNLETNTIRRVSVTESGAEFNGMISNSYSISLSHDGKLLAFLSTASNLVDSDTNGSRDAFLLNTETGRITLVSTSADEQLGDDRSWEAVVSGDGKAVAFSSSATNLIPGDTNFEDDVFLKRIDTENP